MNSAELLTEIWNAGVDAVRGDIAVTTALEEQNTARPDQILAVGKAAAAMAKAARAHFGNDIPALVVTKYDHADGLDDGVKIIEAAHPVPDENSLRGGRALVDVVATMPANSHLLMLVSGGASALAECPVGDMSLAELQAENTRLLSQGLDIHAMNKRRKEISAVKGGGLLSRFQGAHVTTLAISDVEGDALGVIGSGIGDAAPDASFTFDPHIVASNAIARSACATKARELGLDVIANEETLYDDVVALTPRIGQELRDSPKGLRIYGGEPTVILPANPGEGGRNQALALALAQEITDQDTLTVLVAGTDGTDGPTKAAGGLVDGSTWQDEAKTFLTDANSGVFLRRRTALFTSGPTGTNVMDLALALKS
ncbi:DUF4147 domain-containing protein [Shimia abyssi]|uniref:Hydroxypyruvate reductase n=1 Tax=Shimia abyssi TaxID=1662395 RepID=A0A2P8FDQ7_9RHOB|nr:DUF4147 domain-containing protein [Shimia abyssi]PSL19808.1 hydroxypyruvate reductase [Shimia abyssi]